MISYDCRSFLAELPGSSESPRSRSEEPKDDAQGRRACHADRHRHRFPQGKVMFLVLGMLCFRVTLNI
jgi:hypothetical protein